MNTLALVRDPLRDQALLAHSFQSPADLYGFTEYMIMCSKVLRAVDINDRPKPTHSISMVDGRVLFIPLSFTLTDQNWNVYDDLVWRPFEDHALDLVEVFARPYSGSRFPVIHWLWEKVLLPRLYELLRLSWPRDRLTRDQLTQVDSELKEAVFVHAWPDSFFEEAETCPICMETCITTKHPMDCGHWGCDECIMRWLKSRHNSGPFCRREIFSDLENDTG